MSDFEMAPAAMQCRHCGRYAHTVEQGRICQDKYFLSCLEENKSLRQKLATAQEELKEARNVIEDFDLEDQHMQQCRFNGTSDSIACKCMDRTYYNKRDNLGRAREFLSKLQKEKT